ncbi:MAG: hypothetical protein MZU95_12770 [Desulfomicrobium escambiense]|nr:hypothetical protein [Desulfomicrobium escambiense]
MAMKLGQLLEGIDSINTGGDLREEVSTVCYSADQCWEGFFICSHSGLKYDGHDFIAEAIARGAKYIVHEKDIRFSSRSRASRWPAAVAPWEY